MLTVGVIGVAHIHTPAFIKKLAQREDVKVKRVWDPEKERAKKRAEELGVRTVASASRIFKDPEIDAVVICAETKLHKKLVLQAAAAKKHMFVEKPLGMGSKDANTMAQAIEQAGVLFQTGFFMRGNPIHQFLHDQVRKGHFGQITRARASNCHAGSLGGWFDTEWRWMADVSQAGCGAYGDLGTHSLDILLWLFGDVDKVTAKISMGTARYPDCDEFGEGMLQFKNGVTATLAAGWVDVANPASLLISGTEGHAVVFNGQLFYKSNKVEGADGKNPWTDLPEAWPHAFDLFLDAANGKADVPLVSAKEAAYRSSVMEALYKADKQGKWVAPKV